MFNGSAKAWANLDGTGTIALRDDFNVASVTDNGTGSWTFDFSSAFANGNYAMEGGGTGTGLAFSGDLNGPYIDTPTASAFRTLGTSGGSLSDILYALAAFHGDIA